MSESSNILSGTSIEQIDELNRRAWELNRSDPRKGLEFANNALELSEELNYPKGKTQAMASIGACNTWLGDYETSVANLLQAQKSARDLSEPLLESRILYHLFCDFYFLTDYEQALRYSKESHERAVVAGVDADIANALNGVGTVYYTIGENKNAIVALEEGLRYATLAKDKPTQAKILDGLGEAHRNLKETDKAFEYKHRALEIANEIGFDYVIAYAMDGLGEMYIESSDYKKAIGCYEESLRLRKKIGFKVGQGDTFLHIGKTYMLMGKYETALCYLEDALMLGTELDAKALLFKAHLALSELYEKTGDQKLFIEHLKEHYRIREEYNSKKNSQKQRSHELQLQMEKIEQEKSMLEEKNKQLQSIYNDVVLLSDIGQKITSSLSVEEINRTVYEVIQSLIDAPSFGIGIYSEKAGTISFPGYMEDGNKLDKVIYELSDDNRLACVCFKKEQEILIHDIELELGNYVPVKLGPLVGKHLNSVLYLPLKVKDKKVGVITAQSYRKHAFTDYHLNLLKNLAVYTAIALENAQLYEGLEEMVDERSQEIRRQKEEIEKSYFNTQLLSEIGQQITSSLNLDLIFQKLYENVNKLMPAECFGVRIYHQSKNAIEYKFEIENGNKDLDSIMVSMDNDDNFSVWCVKNKEVIFINDNLNEYQKYTKKIVVPMGDMPHSLIFYPLTIGEKVLGVITVQSFRKFAYTPYHIDILKTLGTYTAIALENANLYENLEEKVKERTEEVVKQKEEIEKSFENTRLLSEIGKEISSTLSIEEIITRVYNRINKLMDANAFGIGIYRQKEYDLYHPCVMENGKKLPPFSFDMAEDRIATRCFKEPKEFIINDWKKEYRNYVSEDMAPVEGESPVSLIYLPLISKNKTIGVLSVQSFKVNAYNDYHVAVLRNLAVHVAAALENANLYESLEDKIAERTEEITRAYENTRLLGQIAKDISSSLSIETIIAKVYENVNELMDAASFGIGIYNSPTRELIFPGFMERGERLDNLNFKIDDDRLACFCFRNEKEIFTNNFILEYKKFLSGIQAPIAGKQSSSIVYLPLYTKEKIIGVLTVQSYDTDAYTDYHLDILRNLSHSIASAIENATLYSNLEEKVVERTSEVVKQKEVIEEKNKHITDSIVYAKRIQQAILPPMDVFKTHLQNSFVLYKPKDIVSGDFYWLERKENKILFAVVDCTGHGVPGAFMSIIGYNALNQIVNEYQISKPSEILNQLNKIISSTLKQRADESKIRDGMDMSVCCIDLDTNRLEYAGANNPIFIVRNNEVIEIKADKQPIGNFIGEEEFRFSNRELDLFPSDRLYLFSDGYADQFGGPRGKKLKYNTFRELLIEHHQLPMDQQKDILEQMFEAWRGDLEQIDDVCVIGVAI